MFTLFSHIIDKKVERFMKEVNGKYLIETLDELHDYYL